MPPVGDLLQLSHLYMWRRRRLPAGSPRKPLNLITLTSLADPRPGQDGSGGQKDDRAWLEACPLDHGSNLPNGTSTQSRSTSAGEITKLRVISGRTLLRGLMRHRLGR